MPKHMKAKIDIPDDVIADDVIADDMDGVADDRDSDKRLKLRKAIPPKEFWIMGERIALPSTGMKVRFAGEGEWWNEYSSSTGELYYGK